MGEVRLVSCLFLGPSGSYERRNFVLLCSGGAAEL